MSVFNDYADFYNVFYKDKDYEKEVEYVEGLIKQNIKLNAKTMLNIGCGSGNHDKYFSKKGYKIDGFDLSQKMIDKATELKLKNVNFFVEDIKTYNSPQKYDVIISLFHVLSYQISNQEVNKMFEIVKRNLNKGGVFIFDCWYGPGVLTDPPVIRVKEFQHDNKKIIRIAEPEIHSEKNYVDVNYKVIVSTSKSNLMSEINEKHSMRYFFLPELEIFATKNNLKILKILNWMDKTNPGVNSWNIVFIGTNDDE